MIISKSGNSFSKYKIAYKLINNIFIYKIILFIKYFQSIERGGVGIATNGA